MIAPDAEATITSIVRRTGLSQIYEVEKYSEICVVVTRRGRTGWSDLVSLPGTSAATHFLRCPLRDLVGWHVFDVRCNAPAVAEGVLKLP